MNLPIPPADSADELLGLREELARTRAERDRLKAELQLESERRQTMRLDHAEAIAQRDARLASVERIGNLGSWSWDIAEDRVTWSAELYRIYGRPEGSIRDLAGYLETVQPDYRVAFPETLEAWFAQGGQFRYEAPIVRADGEERYVVSTIEVVKDADGRPVRILGTVQDVTEARQAREALRQREEELRAIIDHTTDAVFIRDLNGHFLLANAACAATFGMTPEQIVGLHVSDLFDAATSRQMFEDDAQVLREDRGQKFERRMTTRDGVTRFKQSNKHPYRAPDGTVLGVIGIGRDVTETHELRAALAERAGALEAANRRLQRLDGERNAWVHTVSHDLRAPLTSITGYAEFLEDGVGGPLNDEQARYVAQIQEATWRVRHLVDDLLQVARLEAGTDVLVLRDLDVAEVLRAEVAMFEPAAQEARIALVADLPATQTLARVDGRRVGQVVRNLLSNAIKFTPAGGRVAIRLRADGEGLRLEVEDTGAGIPEQALPHVFERFYQAARDRGGNGLGLSIAKALVQAHGGRIGVESRAGEGSTFWATFPRGEAR